jgi:hypothetical protein
MPDWMKYSFVCDPNECDALLEFTARDGFDFPSGVIEITCPCGRKMSYISATILPMNERNEMETTPQVPTTYDANVLVTYKSIKNGEATYPVLKVNQLEWEMEEKQRLTDKLNNLQSQVNKIIDNLSATNWYHSNTDKEGVLSELCSILDHEPKQTVRINATITVEVDYDIPMEDFEDFDAHYFIQDNLTIDSWHGDVVIESWNVEDSDVDWNA